MLTIYDGPFIREQCSAHFLSSSSNPMRTAKPKPKPATLKATADKLWSQRIRDIGCCEIANDLDTPCSGRLEAAHIKSRRYSLLRHDLRNGVSLCSAHHRQMHLEPDTFVRWIDRVFPGRIDYLNERMREGSRGPKRPVDYAEVIQRLKGFTKQPVVKAMDSLEEWPTITPLGQDKGD